MGIGFSVVDDDCEVKARWSYSGFYRFRERICNLMKGYIVLIDGIGKEFFVFDNDLYGFLNHSDCDGVYRPETCKKIFPKLKEILNKLDGTDFQDSYDKEHGSYLVEAMKYCAENNKILEVC